jgi:uroporphyrinogen decarboxylase
MMPDLIKHLSGESIGRFPVWMMRQAGRYLPTYRAIRAQHTFWEMVTQPDVAAQVSLLPLEVMALDAVIFFSDILTLPYGMGISIDMVESIGPVVQQPFRREQDFAVFRSFDPESHTGFVGKALKLIRSQMKPETALLGFAGAPWTVACYLIEGSGKKGFKSVNDWATADPESLARALRLLAGATSAYLKFQISSGAHAIQLFDTWIAEMPTEFFEKYYLDILNGIFSDLKTTKAPRIYFTKKSLHVLPQFRELDLDVLSVDDSLTLGEFNSKLKGAFSLQGNLDPHLLLNGTEGEVRLATRNLVKMAQTLVKPPILNLGHGILPKTPVENAQAFVAEARSLWI